MIPTRMCRSYSSQAILFVCLMLLAKVLQTAVLLVGLSALAEGDGSDKEQSNTTGILVYVQFNNK